MIGFVQRYVFHNFGLKFLSLVMATGLWFLIAPDEQPAARIELHGDRQDDPLDDDAVVSVAFNSNGSLLATGARDGVARIWAVPGGREVLRISHGAPVSQIAFRPAVNQVVTSSGDGHVRVFDVARADIVA